MADFKEITTKLKDICKVLGQLQKKDLKSIQDIVDYQKLLNKLSPDLLRKELQEWLEKTNNFLTAEWNRNKENFHKYKNEFVRKLQKENIPMRELDQAWRIGPVKVVFNVQRCSAKFIYNDQVVIPEKIIVGSEELYESYQTACEQLKGAELPAADRNKIFWQAYRNACLLSEEPNTSRIAIKRFYQETLVELYRASLSDRKKLTDKFPLWAFLYNLDCYLQDYKNVPEEQGIAPTAGSQREISQGMGLMINGLDPNREYRTVCHIERKR